MVGIPVILISVWYGGTPLSALVLVISMVGIYEMFWLWRKMGAHIWLPAAVLGGLLYVAAAQAGNSSLDGAALFLTFLAGIIYLVAGYPSFSFGDLAATFFTPLYAGWLLSHIILLRHLPAGLHFVILLFVATWSTDTFAYFVGINLGRHKLAPVLSPNKSIEGSLGGLTGSVLVSLIIGLIGGQLPVMQYIVLGLLIGITGQVGDIFESALKRLAGVKDSGRLIPGHGGILDRFDSLYLTAPVVYYYIKMFV